jgi:hypothetical protein
MALALRSAAVVASLAVTIGASLGAQDGSTQADLDRVDTAIRQAFAFLYQLPRDTAASAMGTWVLDSDATTPPSERSGIWRIVATKLSDTGDGLKLREVAGDGGTSAAQLAASMAAMQRLEGKISKAEADTSLEVTITLNRDVSADGVSIEAPRTTAAVIGTQQSLRLEGSWMKVADRALEIDYERWSPATLVVGFGGFAPIQVERITPQERRARALAIARPAAPPRSIYSIGVAAQGNDEMVERLLKETRWAALAALVN